MDFSKFILNESETDKVVFKATLSCVPVYKVPPKNVFFRTNEDFVFETKVLIDNLKNYYLVDPSLWKELSNELETVKLVFCSGRNGQFFFIAAVTCRKNGARDQWISSLQDGLNSGIGSWVKIFASSSGTYEFLVAKGIDENPKWPELSLNELLELAFKNRMIDNIDHPAIQELRGLV